MKRIFLSLSVFIIAFSSCEEPLTDSEVVSSLLMNEWTHAFEEQEDRNVTEMVFRPSASKSFAASRFRDAYQFSDDSTCRYMFLHPADAHHMKDGTYTYEPKDSTIRIFSEDDVFLKEFKVIKLESDLLVMEITE